MRNFTAVHSRKLFKRWAFSIAFDTATHQGVSYLAVRCRIEHEGSIQNYHLVAIPIWERLTADSLSHK